VPDASGVLALLAARADAVSFESLCEELKLSRESQRAALRARLQQLVTAGAVTRSHDGSYRPAAAAATVTGTIAAHRDGFGFLLPEDGSADLYLAAAEMRQLLDGDKVRVRESGRGPRGQRAGALVEILQRGRETIVGRYIRERDRGVVVDNGRGGRHFSVEDAESQRATPGDLVKLEITRYPSDSRAAAGRIVSVIGDPARRPSAVTDAAIEMYALPDRFPPAAVKAAAALGDVIRDADREARIDLRAMALVTIDGADARDFDDAVYAERDGRGWRLVVAIADVSHYVRPGDALDGEARRRGTSVYFPDRVLPMLPEALSNGLCSLNPAVERLCMVCDMRIDEHGDVTSSRFYRALMQSRQRLIYEDVQAAHDGDRMAGRAVAAVGSELERLYGLYRALAAARTRRGALDLDLPESKIELGSDGHVARIGLRQRTDAHRLIEECMIAANVQAAHYLRRHHLPALFRVHAGPAEEKFEALRLMLQSLGVRIADAARSRTREFNAALESLRQRPDYPVLATAVLRSMAQAVYQPENIGHFGLALSCYAHFTSPIRRYPDLLVHRGIGHILDRRRPAAFDYTVPAMGDLGLSTSAQERRADEATRMAAARYKSLYAAEHIGEEFDGVISGVTGFGLFVTLIDLGIDGLLHVSALGRDYYTLQPGGIRLSGSRTKHSLGLGDTLRVRIARVGVDDGRVDLGLAQTSAPRRHAPHSGRRQRPRAKP